MSVVDRWLDRHPLCICPETTFKLGDIDRKKCRERAHPFDPHPVISAEDLRVVIAALRAALRAGSDHA